ncbi:MAG: hypothetical protein ACR2QC_04110 [Gammaproteobacteria bacterium]
MGEHMQDWRDEPWTIIPHKNLALGFAVGFWTTDPAGERAWVILADGLDERTARLIAAAPDMCELLKAIGEYDGPLPKSLRLAGMLANARALAAKASQPDKPEEGEG